MTQNGYPSTADSTHENGDNLSSGEIRADIDETRASVGDKIDQLQARLDPNRLMQQAQDTVQEMLTDTANSMTEYVRTHKDEMVTSLADAARRNPLPTALVGLGVGWLILESMAGNRSSTNRRYDARTDPYEDAPRYDPRSAGRSGPRFDEQRWQEAWRDPNMGSGMDTGARNRFEDSGGRGASPSDSYYARPDYARPDANGHQEGNPVAKAANAVKEGVSDAADSVKDMAGQVKESVGNMTDQIGDKLNEMGGQGQRTMRRAEGQMSDWQERARYESYQARNAAQRYARSGGRQVMRNLEDNPLIYGAVALATGAAIAMLLPQSRAENRAFGEMRDQVMTKGQEVLESAKEHATTVIEEVRPELEEKARQIVSDATEAGKEVVKSATEELKPVVDKAIAKGKDEARSVAQETGVDPSKLTVGTAAQTSGQNSGTAQGNPSQEKPLIINRDTMKGQWKQVQGEVKKQWGQLTDDDLLKMEGNHDKLVGSIQQRYGYTRERAEREISAFFDNHKA